MDIRRKNSSWALLAAVLLAGAVLGLFLRTDILRSEPAPTPAPQPSGPVEVDLSRLDRGVVSARYTGMFDGKVKLQLVKDGGEKYNYDLNVLERWETYPLSEGNGSYTLTVLEQVEGINYKPVYTEKLELALKDEKAPFLEANQRVDFTADSAAAVLAAELTAGEESDAGKAAILFDYVVDHLTYDKTKAEAAEKGELDGYVSAPDKILAAGKGICLDYAALLCAMLRSVEVPCRLEAGDSQGTYHAWVEVWCEDSGEIDGVIPVEAGAWTLLDPTFVSGKARSEKIMAYVTNRDNYQVKYIY